MHDFNNLKIKIVIILYVTSIRTENFDSNFDDFRESYFDQQSLIAKSFLFFNCAVCSFNSFRVVLNSGNLHHELPFSVSLGSFLIATTTYSLTTKKQPSNQQTSPLSLRQHRS